MHKQDKPPDEIPVLILGGGPAGMACAYELARANIASTLIEKEAQVGGLAKTLVFQQGRDIFRTDIGPHRFFSKNQYLYELIGDLLGDDWIKVNRQTRQFIEGKFYDYPIKAMQAFSNIGLVRAIGMLFSYLSARISYGLLRKDVNSFDDYIVANFGRKLGEFNMLNYTEKIWGIPCDQIHPDWARQRIKGLNLISAVKNALFTKEDKQGPKTLVDAFYYPRHGTGTIYEKIAKYMISQGGQVQTNAQATKILHKHNKIVQVDIDVDGRLQTVKPDRLISAFPINELLGLLSPAPPQEVIDAAGKLRWRSQVYLLLIVDKPQVTDDNWIYFPNHEVPFGRISEMKNFSEVMSPPDKTSLFVEFFVMQGDKTWNKSKEELFALTMKYLEEFGLLRREDVIAYHHLRQTYVYPIYDLNYLEHLAVVKKYLDSFTNLAYIGRPGRFQYTNQDHSLEMGILAAKSIIEGKDYDLNAVGSENEYFEKGVIQDLQ